MENVSFDEYGFMITETDSTDGGSSNDGSERCHDYSPQPGKYVLDNWETVLDSFDKHYKDSPQKLRQLLRKGVPRTLRSRAWQLFLNSNTLKDQSEFNYQTSLSVLQSQLESHGVSEYSSDRDIRILNSLIEVPSSKTQEVLAGTVLSEDDNKSKKSAWARTVRQIMLDIDRSFPHHRLFLGEEAPGKKSLFRILTLYTVYNPTVGYCQGMAYVGGLLLMTMVEEDAFWALVSLFERPKYLAGYYDPSMSRLQTHADVFTLMLKDKLPELAAHLDDLGIHPLLYVTPWFMCLFTTLPCWDTVLAICDILFLEGINTMFRATLAIMKVCAPELMAMYRMEEVIPFLQHLPSRLVSRSNLTRVLWRTPVSTWEVELHTDIVHSHKDSLGMVEHNGQPSRKRGAPIEDEANQSPRATKRRKKESQTQVASTLSLLSRIKNAFTPARLSKPPSIKPQPGIHTTDTHQTKHMDTVTGPLSPKFHTPSVRSSRKRKRRDSIGDDNCDLTVNSSNIQNNENIELVDFSTTKKTCARNLTSGALLRDMVSPMQRLTPVSSPIVVRSPQVFSPFSVGEVSSERYPRRSVRIAKRRSVCRQGGPQGSFPSLSVLSPMTVRPLQEHVQTTTHPREHHAFRMFTTPTPMRGHSQVKRWHDDVCTLTPDVARVTTPVAIGSPDVELKPINH